MIRIHSIVEVLNSCRKWKLKRKMGFSITLKDIENIPKMKVKRRERRI